MTTTTVPQSSVTFSDFYSLAQLRANQENDKTQPDDLKSEEGKAYMKRYSAHVDILESAVAKFMTSLRDAGHLTPFPFAERRGHRFADAWNRFVANDPDAKNQWTLDPIVYSIGHALSFQLSGKDTEVAYANVVKQMDAGAFEARRFNEAENCNVTGVRLSFDIEPGWKPRLGVRNYAARSFEPLTEEAPMPAVLTCKIPAPSGEMLIADWFRLDSNLFTDIVKADAPKESINTSHGCVLLTEHYANKFGFMSVSVGNSSPSIVARDDHLLIAGVYEYGYEDYTDDDEDIADDAKPPLKGEIKGRVCTDLWWTTMIDREVLINLLATKIPREQAEKDVADCIAEYDIAIVKIPSGDAFFHYTADRGDLAFFGCDGPIDVSRDAIEEPFVVISSEPLTWSPLAKVSADNQSTVKCRP